jgi:hypothetical protein
MWQGQREGAQTGDNAPGSPSGHSSAAGPRALLPASSAGTRRTVHAAGGPALTPVVRTVPDGVGGSHSQPIVLPGLSPSPYQEIKEPHIVHFYSTSLVY